MMRFERPPEPEYFDEKVRQKGNKWLAEHPEANSSDYPDYWSKCKKCKADLAKGFNSLCAYSLIRIRRLKHGTIDHYISQKNDKTQVYEWDNYRYASSDPNSLKGNYDDQILDPFEVEDDWFEIILPSCQLLLTNYLPQSKIKKAKFTLEQLQLKDGEQLIEERQNLYFDYIKSKITLDYLEDEAPLIARTIKNVELYLEGGMYYYNYGKYEKAIYNFDQAIHLQQDNPISYNNKGVCYYELGHYSDARLLFNEAITRNNNAQKENYQRLYTQNNYSFYANLSICLEKMGYIQQAIYNLKESINLAQENNKIDEYNYFCNKLKRLES